MRDRWSGRFRAFALSLLALLLVVGLPGRGARDHGALGSPRPVVVGAASLASTAGEPSPFDTLSWAALTRHAAEAPLHARLPDRPAPIVLTAPRTVRAGRTAALRVRALEHATVTRSGADGTDTLRLSPGDEGAFLLRPFAPGWRAWSLRVEGRERPPIEDTWSALIRPERRLRVLTVSGPPGPEGRWASRALEESGEVVEAWIHLGRGIWSGRREDALPTDPAAYDPFDVILVFPGTEFDGPQAQALLDAVRHGGKGLLFAATTAASDLVAAQVAVLAGGGGWQRSGERSAEGLAWDLPPEIPPLPDLPVRTRAMLTQSEPATPVSLGSWGRGRMGALALADSWAWRMLAGEDEGHRAFWSELVSWLAGGFSENPVLEVLGDDPRDGELLRVRRVARSDASIPGGWLELHGPEGVASVPFGPERTTPAGGVALAGFVTSPAGRYTVRPVDEDATDTTDATAASAATAATHTGDAQPALALEVRPLDPTGLDPAGRLARLAVASPGGRVLLGDTPVPPGVPEDHRDTPLAAILFALLAAALASGWGLRRWAGRP